MLRGDVAICGPHLYQDDIAHSTRARYLELVDEGLPPDDAVTLLLRESDGLVDEEASYRCPFWLALAETQRSRRELTPRVRDIALGVIDRGEDLALWSAELPEMRSGRASELARLRALLAGETEPKKRRVRRKIIGPPWDVGDVLGWDRGGGRSAWLHFFAMSKNAPVFYALDWNAAEPPSIEALPEIVIKESSRTLWKFSLVLPDVADPDAARWTAEVEPRFAPRD